MRRKKHNVTLAMTATFSVIIFCVAWAAHSPWLGAAGALGLQYVLLRAVYLRQGPPAEADAEPPQPAAMPRPPVACREPIDLDDSEGLVERMLTQRRYALLLRPKIVANLSNAMLRQAREALEQDMALVPDGEVALGQIDDALDDGRLHEEELETRQVRVVKVERFFLDRFPVTNRQFLEFVSDGGYQQMALWDKSIWAAVLDLVDSTGMPGPRYWRDGSFLPGEENHPVVGVCWHEASAYARWAGKRLPTDAEWVKAGSWPVPLSPTTRMQRRYPWGDTMDRTRANLWNPRSARTVAVEESPEGVSVGSVYQLIGNVWEWTGGDFRATDHAAGRLELPSPMKSIRGGAFDTYFDNQATCQFQSGENPLGRKRNIGFRCAVGVCDLVLARHASDDPPDDDPPDEAQLPDGHAADGDPAVDEPVQTIEKVQA